MYYGADARQHIVMLAPPVCFQIFPAIVSFNLVNIPFNRIGI